MLPPPFSIMNVNKSIPIHSNSIDNTGSIHIGRIICWLQRIPGRYPIRDIDWCSRIDDSRHYVEPNGFESGVCLHIDRHHELLRNFNGNFGSIRCWPINFKCKSIFHSNFSHGQARNSTNVLHNKIVYMLSFLYASVTSNRMA